MSPKVQARTQRDARIGSVLDERYRIMDKLGSGGMGEVYAGQNVSLGRRVAIKFLHASGSREGQFRTRFDREARAMARLSHPCCVSVIDFGIDGNAPYIVMDFVEGTTVDRLLSDGPLPIARALDVQRQLLAGLAHAHSQGIMHRDIKPSNLIVSDAEGMGDHVQIFDFGLAKLFDPATGHAERTAETIIGTPAYMSPEQCLAERVDARTDIYAAGIVLFEMLTGKKPFRGESPLETITMQRDKPAPALSEAAPDAKFSREIEAVVHKALEKTREARFQSAAEFLAALEETPEAKGHASVPPEARVVSGRETSVSATAPTLPQMRRKRLRAAAAVGTAVLSIGVVVWLTSSGGPQDDPQQPASEAEPADTTTTTATAESADIAEPQEPSGPEAPPSEDAIEAEPPSQPSDQPSPAPEPTPSKDAVEANPPSPQPPPHAPSAPEPDARRAPPPTERTSKSDRGASPSRLERAKALLERGQHDAAIDLLQALRKQMPRSGYVAYLLGNAYFGKRWWSDAMLRYQSAVRLDNRLRDNRVIIRNAIQALGSDKTYPKARRLLVGDIGRYALPHLRRARRQGERKVKRRAASIIKAIRH